MIRTVRSMGLSFVLSVMLVGALAAPAPAFLIGAPTFTAGPSSTMGPITLNTLTITSFPNGFQVTGQIGVSLTSAAASGVLLSYTVDHPIDPTYPLNPALFTTTIIDGYSLPPLGGSAGNSAGFVHSTIVTLPNTYLGPSASQVLLSLVAGADNPPWTPPLMANSSPFPFAGAPNMVLRQEFFLDANYLGGPPGTWIIDLPVLSAVNLPEPSAFVLAALGLAALGLIGWWKRSRHAA